jgi:tRNA-binding protein
VSGPAAAPPLTWEDFVKVDVRVGRIVAADEFPAARKPAYRLRIDFGALGEKQSSAQITKRYRREELPGRLVVAVVNFPPKRIAGFVSEVLVLGAMAADDEVVLLRPDQDVAPGMRVA